MAITEAQTHALAAGLADAAGAPMVEVKFPAAQDDWSNEENAPSVDPEGWTPPPGFWSIEHAPAKSPVVLRFEGRDPVAGIVPGDGVWLHHNGAPHSAGRVTSISEKDGVIRVIVEDLRPIGAS